MMKEFLETGKIVGTHGVRGMVRIQPWCDDADFLCGFEKIYIKEGRECLSVGKMQPHGNVVIAALSGVDSIEKAEALRGSDGAGLACRFSGRGGACGTPAIRDRVFRGGFTVFYGSSSVCTTVARAVTCLPVWLTYTLATVAAMASSVLVAHFVKR